MNLSFHISDNYAIDMTAMKNIRGISDGMSWFNFDIESDWYKGDHNPQFKIHLVAMNVTIIEIVIYNVHHLEEK